MRRVLCGLCALLLGTGVTIAQERAYCPADANSPSYEKITNVQFNTINNSSPAAPAPGY